MAMYMFHPDVLSLILRHLHIPDVLQLSLASKEARVAVMKAWNYASKPRIGAVAVASLDNRVLLINPLAGGLL